MSKVRRSPSVCACVCARRCYEVEAATHADGNPTGLNHMELSVQPASSLSLLVSALLLFRNVDSQINSSAVPIDVARILAAGALGRVSFSGLDAQWGDACKEGGIFLEFFSCIFMHNASNSRI